MAFIHSVWSTYWLTIVVSVISTILIASVLRHEKTRALAREEIPNLLTEDEWISGRDLRQKLLERGIFLSYGSFYILMREFVEEGVVVFQDKSENVDEEQLPFRVFRLR